MMIREPSLSEKVKEALKPVFGKIIHVHVTLTALAFAVLTVTVLIGTPLGAPLRSAFAALDTGAQFTIVAVVGFAEGALFGIIAGATWAAARVAQLFAKGLSDFFAQQQAEAMHNMAQAMMAQAKDEGRAGLAFPVTEEIIEICRRLDADAFVAAVQPPGEGDQREQATITMHLFRTEFPAFSEDEKAASTLWLRDHNITGTEAGAQAGSTSIN